VTAPNAPERVERTLSAAGLIDALDRLIADGVTVTGDVVIGIGDVDLIRLDLRALLIGVQGSAS
jgi:hypothetical protein